MSTSWHDGGQSYGYDARYGGAFQNAASPTEERPPICFNCGNEGHFVIACPDPIKSNLAGLASARPPVGVSAGSTGAAFQKNYWANGHNGAVVTRYPVPKAAPVVTRYPVPQAPQYVGGSSAYPATTYRQYAGPDQSPRGTSAYAASTYQHYAGPDPNTQGYQAQTPQVHTPHPAYQASHSYGAPGPSYDQAHPQATQGYAGPTMNYQYGQQGSQPLYSQHQYAPYTQYPPIQAAPQYGAQLPQHQVQQYGGQPQGEMYQQSPSGFPAQSSGYGEDFRRPSVPGSYQGSRNQWSNSAAPYASQSSPADQHQRSVSNQYDADNHREFSGTPSLPASAQEHSVPRDGCHQTPQTPASNYSQQQVRPISHSSPVLIPAISQNSSRASTPYGRYGYVPNGVFTGPEHNPTLLRTSDSADAPRYAGQGENGEDDEETFNWEYKAIFKEPETQETVALAQPLSTTFDMTPVPLLDSRSINSVSRYARLENLKEFVRTIRSAPQWSYLKEDPAFVESEIEGSAIPLSELPAWMATHHGAEDVPSCRQGGKKSAWSDEQDDVDNQIILEAALTAALSGDSISAEQQSKRSTNSSSLPQQSESGTSDRKSSTPTAVPGTPVYVRDGSPSCDPEDDVWAPQPGEGAYFVSANPTEALLASLGVSGSPKPVISDPIPPLMPVGADDHFQPPDMRRRSSSFANHTTGSDSHSMPPIGPPPPPPRHNNAHFNNSSYTAAHLAQSQYEDASSQYDNAIPSTSPGFNGGPHHNGPRGYQYHNGAANQPKNIPRNAYYNGSQTHTYGPPLTTQFENSGQNNYVDRPPMNHQFNANQPAPSPMRQDSGYISAREPPINGDSRDSLKRRNSHLESQGEGPSYKRTVTSIGVSLKENTAPKREETQDADTESGESPLSPTSAEILGKLLPATNKNGKRETQRQLDHTMKKRRQPVVAEAYSRRW